MDCSLPGSSFHGHFPDKNTGVGCHALLQGVFPTQGLNPCLLRVLHWRGNSVPLHHLGSLLLLLEWLISFFPSPGFALATILLHIDLSPLPLVPSLLQVGGWLLVYPDKPTGCWVQTAERGTLRVCNRPLLFRAGGAGWKLHSEKLGWSLEVPTLSSPTPLVLQGGE